MIGRQIVEAARVLHELVYVRTRQRGGNVLQLLWVPDAEKLLRAGGAGVEQFAAGGEVKSGQLLQSVESSASESQQHLGTGFLALGELFEIDGAHGISPRMAMVKLVKLVADTC
jgi:hypothetical protein